jgi:heme/copper-type cytochrome/quinol oxidase subunit 3
VGFLAIAATALGALLFSYFYLRLYATQWPQDGLPLPEVMPALAMFAVLAASALPQSWGARAVDRLSRGRLLLGLGGALAAQVAFLAGQAALLSMVPFPAAANAYASIFWVLHVALAVLVALGAAWNVGTLGRCFRRLEDGRPTTRLMLEIATLLGNFAAAAGVVVWVTLYASPRWL